MIQSFLMGIVSGFTTGFATRSFTEKYQKRRTSQGKVDLAAERAQVPSTQHLARETQNKSPTQVREEIRRAAHGTE